MVEKIETESNELVLEPGSEAEKEIKNACDYINDNLSICQKDLLNMINGVQVGDDQNKLFSDEERNKLTTYLSESITNLSLQLKNKSNRCRYSEHAINVSMSLHLRSKSSYTLMRKKQYHSITPS